MSAWEGALAAVSGQAPIATIDSETTGISFERIIMAIPPSSDGNYMSCGRTLRGAYWRGHGCNAGAVAGAICGRCAQPDSKIWKLACGARLVVGRSSSVVVVRWRSDLISEGKVLF